MGRTGSVQSDQGDNDWVLKMFLRKQQHNLSINIQSCMYSSNSGTLGIHNNYFRFTEHVHKLK